MQPPKLALPLLRLHPTPHRLKVPEAEDGDVLQLAGLRVGQQIQPHELVPGKAAHRMREARHLLLELLRPLPTDVVVADHGESLHGILHIRQPIFLDLLVGQELVEVFISSATAPSKMRRQGLVVHLLAFASRIQAGDVIARRLDRDALLHQHRRFHIPQPAAEAIRRLLQRLYPPFRLLYPLEQARIRLVLRRLEEAQALFQRAPQHGHERDGVEQPRDGVGREPRPQEGRKAKAEKERHHGVCNDGHQMRQKDVDGKGLVLHLALDLGQRTSGAVEKRHGHHAAPHHEEQAPSCRRLDLLLGLSCRSRPNGRGQVQHDAVLVHQMHLPLHAVGE
eukprot:scaffold183_cov249-Pinguiococcus_pyrenoidosus.AAC.14